MLASPPYTRTATIRTMNLPRWPAGSVSMLLRLRRAAPRRPSAREASAELRAQFVHGRDRQLARETLADVGRGIAVDRHPALEHRDSLTPASREDEVRIEATVHDPGEFGDVLACQRDLAHGSDDEVNGPQQVAERERVLGGDGVQQLDQ